MRVVNSRIKERVQAYIEKKLDDNYIDEKELIIKTTVNFGKTEVEGL